MINQERLVKTFMDLVKVDSETRHEGNFQKYLEERFRLLGVSVFADNAAALTGFGGNNLLCRYEGEEGRPAVFFSSHMDTVTPGQGIKPQIVDGNICSDQTTILGADDKAGIAIMLELIEVVKENHIPHGTIEFVISIGEESGLVGIKVFDCSQLRAKFGFILDNAGPVGSIVVGSPTHYWMNISIQGLAAHAGLEPEKGISALAIAVEAMAEMKLGRIDSETTANVGVIKGGTANNVVMDHLDISAEARSISKEKCEAQVKHMVERFEKAAAKHGGQVKIETTKMYEGFRFGEDTKVVQIASQAIQNIGSPVRFEESGGGSDTNIFNAEGYESANLSIGYEKVHTVYEYIPASELTKAALMAVEIVKVVYQQ